MIYFVVKITKIRIVRRWEMGGEGHVKERADWYRGRYEGAFLLLSAPQHIYKGTKTRLKYVQLSKLGLGL